MGVVFFVGNAAFSLVLILIVLVASLIAIFSKNPDTRYQPMRDDRGSFIKSQTNMTTELDALGATARGEGKHNGGGFDYGHEGKDRFGDDNESWSGGSSSQSVPQIQHTAYKPYGDQPPRSPIATNMPNFPADGNNGDRHAPPSYGGGAYGNAGGMVEQQRLYPQNSGSPWQRGAGYD